MKSLVTLILLYSVSAQASLFQKVYTGYQGSERLEEINMSSKFTELNYLIGQEQFDWKLGTNFQYQDSFLAALFSFQGQKTITEAFTVSLTKPSYKYGTFSISNRHTIYDLSNWTTTNLSSFNSDQLFESRNIISYEYEFLNRSQEIDWEIVHIQNLANNTEDNLKTQKDHYDFFSAYLTAKHKIELHKLYKEFEKRAQTRVNQISRRVRDGLSRKVDLDQARLSLFTQQETILTNKSDLRLAVATIEDIVGVQLPESQYVQVSWSFKPAKKKFSYLLDEAKFIELENLKAQNQLAEANVEKQNETAGSSLTLNLSYTKNAFEEESSDAFSESIGSSPRDEKVVSLNYVFPLGFSKRDAVKEKLILQKNKTTLNLKNRESTLKVQHRVLLENIDRYEEAISLAQRKVEVAQRVVAENKRLYLRGQITFEESLRAEETLINARLTKVNMLLAHETVLAELALMTGEIKPFLRDYRD